MPCIVSPRRTRCFTERSAAGIFAPPWGFSRTLSALPLGTPARPGRLPHPVPRGPRPAAPRRIKFSQRLELAPPQAPPRAQVARAFERDLVEVHGIADPPVGEAVLPRPARDRQHRHELRYVL